MFPGDENRATVTFDLGAFGEAIRAAKPAVEDRLVMNGYCVVGSSTAIEGGPATAPGGLAVNARRMATIAKVMGGEATMDYQPGGNSPILFTAPAVDGYSILLMPLPS